LVGVVCGMVEELLRWPVWEFVCASGHRTEQNRTDQNNIRN
jgi:hypothetical protein